MERRRRSGWYLYYGVGIGVPLAVAGVLLVWVGTMGYPVLGVIGVGGIGLGVRILFGTLAGGVRVEREIVDVRGWVRRHRVGRPLARAIVMNEQWPWGCRGWIDTPAGRMHLSGISVSHNHLSVDRCSVCNQTRADLASLAEELEVPFEILAKAKSGKSF